MSIKQAYNPLQLSILSYEPWNFEKEVPCTDKNSRLDLPCADLLSTCRTNCRGGVSVGAVGVIAPMVSEKIPIGA